jgi:hypothetical protein
MASVRTLWTRGYQRLGPRRARLAPLLLGEAAVLVLVAILGVVLQVVTASHPDRVSTRVQVCDLATRGAAQVTFTLNNGDRISHNYKVTLVVTAAGSRQLGAGAILVNRVEPGATVTSRMLVPLAGDPTGASCVLRADLYTGPVMGHN